MGHYDVARSYGTNGLNQPIYAGTTALGYDATGCLLSITNVTGSPLTYFDYGDESLF